MLPSAPNAKPSGNVLNITAQPRDIFYSGREYAQWLAVPVTIDSANTRCPSNQPYVWQIVAGTLLGKITATKKYGASIIGPITAYTSGTTLSTDVYTATEVVRRFGASGTFILNGPVVSGGPMAPVVVTYSSVSLTTGAITITALGTAYAAGAVIQPQDGSQNIITAVSDIYGVKVEDPTNTTNLDAFDPGLPTGGGMINTSLIVSYGTEPSVQAWIKSSLKAACGNGLTFNDDF